MRAVLLAIALSTMVPACSPAATVPDESAEPAPRSYGQTLRPDHLALLRAPDRLELLTLYPQRDQQIRGVTNSLDSYPVLGRADIATPEERSELTSAVLAAKLLRLRPGERLTCAYSPRHALVATKGAERLEVLICFSCGHVDLDGRMTQLTDLGGAESVFSTYVNKYALRIDSEVPASDLPPQDDPLKGL